MKLSELRAAIRKQEGHITHPMNFASGCSVQVALQKTSLLEALGEAFDNDRSAETGLTLQDGELKYEP